MTILQNQRLQSKSLYIILDEKRLLRNNVKKKKKKLSVKNGKKQIFFV